MSDKSPATPSLDARPSSVRDSGDPLHEDPDLISISSEAAQSRRARFFHKLNKSRHKAPGVSAVMPHAFHRWTHRKAKEHVAGEEEGTASGDEEANAGRKDQHDDPDKPGFRMKNRYLPIISGLACPFSVLLDIPGLTERWYVKSEGGTVVDTQPNSTLLDVALGFSIAFGLIANAFLIVRFLEKQIVRSTWIAMITLTIHDLINIATLVVFGVVHRVNDGFDYGISYWMSVAATVASLTCNVTLVMDYIKTKDFGRNGSGLTEKQRSLVISVMIFLGYLGFGALIHTYIISDPDAAGTLSFIDALYFTIVTVTSVGFGDYYPVRAGSKVFAFFYDTGGLILLGFTISIMRETTIETFEASYRHRREELAARARERKAAKRERLKQRRLEREKQLREQIAQGRNVDKGDLPPVRETSKPTLGGGRGGAGGAATKQAKIERAKRELDWDAEKVEGVSAGKRWVRLQLRRIGWMKAYTPNEADLMGKVMEDEGGDQEGGTSLRRTSSTISSASSEEKFISFKKQLQNEQSKEFRLKLSVVGSIFLAFWLIGAAVFHACEGWGYGNALYFSYITFTTIGYGEYSPSSSGGRAFFIAWAIFGIASVTLVISVLTESWSSRYKSSISEGKTKKVIRRLGKRSNKAHDQSALKMLKLEGFGGTDEPISAEELPQKLMDAVKGFHEHARYFMFGRTGDTPESLRPLLDAADQADDQIERYAEGDLAESAANGETRHFLFLISYERQFDILLDMAEQLAEVFQQHGRELKEMKALNDRMRSKLEEMGEDLDEGEDDDEDTYSDLDEDDEHEEDDEEEDEEGEHEKGGRGSGKGDDDDSSCSSPHRGPFEKRPPGGFGDDKEEHKLEDELDGPGSHRPAGRRGRSGDGEREGGQWEKDGEQNEATHGPLEKRPKGGPADEGGDDAAAREVASDRSPSRKPRGKPSHKPISTRPSHDHTPDKRREAELNDSDEEAKAREEMFFGPEQDGNPTWEGTEEAEKVAGEEGSGKGRERRTAAQEYEREVEEEQARKNGGQARDDGGGGQRPFTDSPRSASPVQDEDRHSKDGSAKTESPTEDQPKPSPPPVSDNPTPAGRAVRRASVLLDRVGSRASSSSSQPHPHVRTANIDRGPSASGNNAPTPHSPRQRPCPQRSASGSTAGTARGSALEKSGSRVAFADDGQQSNRERSGSGSMKTGPREDRGAGSRDTGPKTGTARTKVGARFDRMAETVRGEEEEALRQERRDQLEKA